MDHRPLGQPCIHIRANHTRLLFYSTRRRATVYCLPCALSCSDCLPRADYHAFQPIQLRADFSMRAPPIITPQLKRDLLTASFIHSRQYT